MKQGRYRTTTPCQDISKQKVYDIDFRKQTSKNTSSKNITKKTQPRRR